MSDPKYLTVEQAAAVIQMSPAFVRRRCKEKKLPAVKLGRDWRIRPADLDAFMQPERVLPETPRKKAS